MADLKPCPFCGGEAKAESESGEGWLFGEMYGTVSCPECDAAVASQTLDEAVQNWNRRTPVLPEGCRVEGEGGATHLLCEGSSGPLATSALECDGRPGAGVPRRRRPALPRYRRLSRNDDGGQGEAVMTKTTKVAGAGDSYIKAHDEGDDVMIELPGDCVLLGPHGRLRLARALDPEAFAELEQLRERSTHLRSLLAEAERAMSEDSHARRWCVLIARTGMALKGSEQSND